MDVVNKVRALRLAGKLISDPVLVKQLNDIIARKSEINTEMIQEDGYLRFQAIVYGDLADKCKEFLASVEKTLEG